METAVHTETQALKRAACSSFPTGCQCTSRTCVACGKEVFAHDAYGTDAGWQHVACVVPDGNVVEIEVKPREVTGLWHYRFIRRDDSKYGTGEWSAGFASKAEAKVAAMEKFFKAAWRGDEAWATLDLRNSFSKNLR